VTPDTVAKPVTTISDVVTLMDRQQAELLSRQPYSYPVGAVPPDGYRHLAVREVIGSGRPTFEQAADKMLSWRMQEASGFEVVASEAAVRPGVVAVLVMRLGPLRVTAPCRVIESSRDEHRAGFTYGTLPGHPVSGQESFLVERHDDDTVTASVTAFSRPGRWFTWLAAPVLGIAQERAARGYIRVLRPG
jgi:uncharacterized protein (UPF0548 family)